MTLIDVVMSLVVLLFFAVIVGAYARSYSKSMQSWLWIGFAEYVAAAIAQFLYTRVLTDGGDVISYSHGGQLFAEFLDENFSLTAPELVALFFQQDSALDFFMDNPHTNTGSMHAAAGALTFLLRGSDYAANFAVAGLSYLSMLSMHRAFRALYPEQQEERLFIATVMVPSIPFWTSGLYKEAFCMMGFALFFSGWWAWRGRRYLAAAGLTTPGIGLIYLFRPPMLVPLFLGVVAFYLVERTRSVRRRDEAAVLTPVYFIGSLIALVAGMAAIGRYVPSLAVTQVSDTISAQHGAWSAVEGGSTLATNDAPMTFAGQMLALPAGLLNALFRPQVFDITNPAIVVSAAEMSAVTWVLVQALRRRGLTGVVTLIRRSPFLTLCAVITIVGCALVGLVTRNLGSLVRYRTPFFPFYAAMIISLAYATATKRATAAGSSRSSALARALARRQALRDGEAADPSGATRSDG